MSQVHNLPVRKFTTAAADGYGTGTAWTLSDATEVTEHNRTLGTSACRLPGRAVGQRTETWHIIALGSVLRFYEHTWIPDYSTHYYALLARQYTPQAVSPGLEATDASKFYNRVIHQADDSSLVRGLNHQVSHILQTVTWIVCLHFSWWYSSYNWPFTLSTVLERLQ